MTNLNIHTCKGTQQLSFENIVRIESRSNYCKIFFADKTFPLTISKTLAWVEQNLPASIFLRIHRTHLVNKDFISSTLISNNHLELLNGEKICISRRRKLYVHKMIA